MTPLGQKVFTAYDLLTVIFFQFCSFSLFSLFSIYICILDLRHILRKLWLTVHYKISIHFTLTKQGHVLQNFFETFDRVLLFWNWGGKHDFIPRGIWHNNCYNMCRKRATCKTDIQKRNLRHHRLWNICSYKWYSTEPLENFNKNTVFFGRLVN